MIPTAFGNEETQYFYSLTPDRILDTVESWGVRCTGRSLALNSMENRVYEVEIDVENDRLPRNSPERFRIVKFYRPGRWSREQILDEHRFLIDLEEYDIPVVAPLCIKGEETLVPAKESSILCSLFRRVGGRSPSELTKEQLPLIGRLLARMHGVGKTKIAEHRIRIDPQTYGLQNLNYLLENNIIPPHFEERYRSTVLSICELSAPWFEQVDYQRIHGDCHLGNLIWGDAGPFWVDFDDMLQGPCVQDLWLLAPGRDQESADQLETLIQAYEQMKEFDRRSLRLIEPLRSLRMIHFHAWIAARWSDPAFSRTFVEFGSERYWGEQIQGLEQQLTMIRSSEGR